MERICHYNKCAKRERERERERDTTNLTDHPRSALIRGNKEATGNIEGTGEKKSTGICECKATLS